MTLRRWLVGVGAGTLFLLGGILTGPLGAFAKSSPPSTPATVQSQTNTEADQASRTQTQPAITSDQAKQAALAANPGTSVTQASLNDENGTLIYNVELSNGSDVKVDASTGTILSTDAADSREADQTEKASSEDKAGTSADHDNVQQGSTSGADTESGRATN